MKMERMKNKMERKNRKIVVMEEDVRVMVVDSRDYICLTDIARYKNIERVNSVVQNWMRNQNTLEFLGLWEKINNDNFKDIEFDVIRSMSGLNSFVLSPGSWVSKTGAIGLVVKSGRYGGTYAHKDIAFEFASWISPKFKLYLIKEFQRLKEVEIKKNESDWDLKRNLVRINYKIHTEAIKDNLIPAKITKEQEKIIYANETDLLNVALFGVTNRIWKIRYKKEGNMRDYASPSQLVCLSNLESLNSVFIGEKLGQGERLIRLNGAAIIQMKILEENVVVGSSLG